MLVPNFIAQLYSRSLQPIAGLLLYPLYLRQLSFADLGVYALATATATLFVAPVSLNLSAALLRFFPKYQGRRQLLRAFVTAHVVSTTTIALLLSALCLVAAQASDAAVLLPGVSPVLIAVLTNVYLIRANFERLTRLRRIPQPIALASSLETAARVLFTLIAFVAERLSPSVLLLIHTCAVAFSAIILAHANRSLLTIQFPFCRFLPSSLGFSLRLLPHSLAKTAERYADRYIIAACLSAELLGVYDLIRKVASPPAAAAKALSQALFPQLLTRSTRSPGTAEQDQGLLCLSAFVVFSLPLGAAYFAEPVLALFADQVARYWLVVPLLTLAETLPILLPFYSTRLYLLNKPLHLSALAIAATTITLIFNFVLIPSFALHGAAVAAVLGILVRICLTILAAGPTGLSLWRPLASFAVSTTLLYAYWSNPSLLSAFLTAVLSLACFPFIVPEPPLRALGLDHPGAKRLH